MANLQSFKKSIARAKTIREESAAATSELTKQFNEKPETVTFVFPSAGVNLGQLEKEMKSAASPKAMVSKEGDMIRVVTSNGAAASKVLAYLGISAEPSGEVSSTPAAETPEVTV